MSHDNEEDHEDTAKRLDEDFAGANKVRGTSKECMKTGIGRRTEVTSTVFEQ
jgi:hypothetical protein